MPLITTLTRWSTSARVSLPFVAFRTSAQSLGVVLKDEGVELTCEGATDEF